MSALVLAWLAVSGCKSNADRTPPEVTSVRPALATASVVPTPAETGGTGGTTAALPDTVTAAVFDKDTLVACVDYGLTVSAELLAKVPQGGQGGAPMGARDLARDDLLGFLSGGDSMAGAIFNRKHPGTAAKARPKGEAQSIEQPCARQFDGRTIISHCSISEDKHNAQGAGYAARLDLFYYGVTGDDRWMTGCLGAGGTWDEVPHDSLAYMRADHQRLYQELKKQ